MPMHAKISELISTDSPLTARRFAYGNPHFILWSEVGLKKSNCHAIKIIIYGGN
jgi:hypothetical protein